MATVAEMIARIDHGWSIVPADRELTRLTLDWAVNLELGHGVDTVHIRIESPFVVEVGEVETLVLPEQPETVAVMLPRLRRKVVSIGAFDDGHLEVGFDDGSSLSVAATEDYEPWGLTGPSGLRIVSIPGGEIAVWTPTTDDPAR